MDVSRACRFSSVAAFVVACATGQQVDNGYVTVVPDGTGGVDAGLAAGGAGGDGTTENAGAPVGNGGMSPMSTGGAPHASTGGASPASSGGNGAVGSGGTAASGGMATSTGGADTGGAPSSGGSSGAQCSSTEKLCGGACVGKTPDNGCDAASCSACSGTAPDHGSQVCDAQGDCDFECASGFAKNGTQCSPSTGSGGASGSGGSGQGGQNGSGVTCGNNACRKCPGNQTTCCDKLTGNLCFCALQGQESAFCK